MKIFLTGANGFLGSNLVRKLLAEGYQIKALVHPQMVTNTLDGLDVEIAYGNLLNTNDVQTAMKGCNFVIHAAASTNVWPSRSQMVRNVNINGTQNILDAIEKNNIERAVYVGTASSFGFGTKQNPGNETTPYKSAKYGLDYIDSKYETHKMVVKRIEDNKLPITIVNPTFMLGPHDAKPGPGEMILAFHAQRIPGYTAGGRNYVHVNDAAIGIANALQKGKFGESYILGNQNLSYREFFNIVSEVTQKPPLKIGFPSWLIKAYGGIDSGISSLTRKKPTVSYAMACISCDGQYYSAKKAVKELDMPQTPVKQAIEDAFNWFVENNYLKK